MACGTREGSAVLYDDYIPQNCIKNSQLTKDCESPYAHSYKDYFEATLQNFYLCLMPENTTFDDAGTGLYFLNYFDSGLLASFFDTGGVTQSRLRRVFFSQTQAIDKLAFYVGNRKLGNVGGLEGSVYAALNPLSQPVWALFALFACLWLALLRCQGRFKIPLVGYGIFCALLAKIYKANLEASVIAFPPEPFSSVADLAHKHLSGQLTFVYHTKQEFAYKQIGQLPALRPLAAALKSRPPRQIYPLRRFCEELRRDETLVALSDTITVDCDSSCLYQVQGVEGLPWSLGSFIFPLQMDRRARDRADMFVGFARTSLAYHKSRVGPLPQCMAGERSEHTAYSTLQVIGPVAILFSLQSLTFLVFALEHFAHHLVHSIVQYDSGTGIDFLNYLNSGMLSSYFEIFGVTQPRLPRVFFSQPQSIDQLAFYMGNRQRGQSETGSLDTSVYGALNPLSPPVWAVFVLFACLWIALLRYPGGPKRKIPAVGYGIFCALLVKIYKANLEASGIAPGIPKEPFSSVADLAQKHLSGQLNFVCYGKSDFAYKQIELLPALGSLAAALKSRPPREIQPIERLCEELRRDETLVTLSDTITVDCDSSCLHQVQGVEGLPWSLGSFIFQLQMGRLARDRADMFVGFARTSLAYHKSRVGPLPQCVVNQRSENGPYSTLKVFGPVAILLSLQFLSILVFALENSLLHSIVQARVQGGGLSHV